MIVYTVFLKLEIEIENDWVRFMNDKHISDVMNTGCFLDYKLLRQKDPASNDNYVNYRVDYYLESINKMDEYIQNFATKLRNDVINIFGSKFKAEREIYELISPNQQ